MSSEPLSTYEECKIVNERKKIKSVENATVYVTGALQW